MRFPSAIKKNLLVTTWLSPILVQVAPFWWHSRLYPDKPTLPVGGAPHYKHNYYDRHLPFTYTPNGKYTKSISDFNRNPSRVLELPVLGPVRAWADQWPASSCSCSCSSPCSSHSKAEETGEVVFWFCDTVFVTIIIFQGRQAMFSRLKPWQWEGSAVLCHLVI